MGEYGGSASSDGLPEWIRPTADWFPEHEPVPTEHGHATTAAYASTTTTTTTAAAAPAFLHWCWLWWFCITAWFPQLIGSHPTGFSSLVPNGVVYAKLAASTANYESLPYLGVDGTADWHIDTIRTKPPRSCSPAHFHQPIRPRSHAISASQLLSLPDQSATGSPPDAHGDGHKSVRQEFWDGPTTAATLNELGGSCSPAHGHDKPLSPIAVC